MSRVTVTLDGVAGAARRVLQILDGRIIRDDAEFKESDHPRAGNGQFGSGGSVHAVTTHDSDTGETTFHHVGTDKTKAAAERDRVEDGDDDEGIDGDDSAEHHAPKIEGKKGQRSDTVHIVHAPDGAGGVDVHGAHLDYGRARAQAHDLSKAEWEENGARRSEVGLSDDEANDLATQWNEDHAGDHADVQVKVDEDGDPVLDDSGGFQFVQDGEDVAPTDEMVEAFDGLREELYPEDDVAPYPGLEDANAHFTDEGRHEAVFSIYKHEAA